MQVISQAIAVVVVVVASQLSISRVTQVKRIEKETKLYSGGIGMEYPFPPVDGGDFDDDFKKKQNTHL